jgi:YfiH family protein
METITEQMSIDNGFCSEIDDKTLAESGFRWRERGAVKVLVCEKLAAAGFANGFSTRLGGVSPFPKNDLNLAGFDEDTTENIYENRRRFLDAFDGEYRLATAWQVHGDNLRVVRDEAEIGDSEIRADGLLSDLTGVLVGVKTADCVPILFADPTNKAFAAVHAGWRGTAQSIVPKAIAKMTAVYGTNPANLICAIGPAAGCEMYEIGSEVIETFERNFAESTRYFTPTREGHALIDLSRANRDQIADAGVSPENTYTAPFCTIKRTDLFFSYRIEKKRYGKTGRLLSVIGVSSNRGAGDTPKPWH